MHCSYCRKKGHKINVCPDKPADYVPPKSSVKKGRHKKTMPQVVDETKVEVELLSKKAATGEATLIEEVLNQMENDGGTEEEPVPRFEDVQIQPKLKMKFVPIPGIRYNKRNLEGSTPTYGYCKQEEKGEASISIKSVVQFTKIIHKYKWTCHKESAEVYTSKKD